MESGVLQPLLTWIGENPGLAGAAIFMIAFVESLVVIGFFLPGILILFGVGALIGLGEASLIPVWVGGTLGAICGDLVSFWIGHRYQNQLRKMWPF
jgi:undecaprenyl-diphosphatase